MMNHGSPFVRSLYRIILRDAETLLVPAERQYVRNVVRFGFRKHMHEEAEDVDELTQRAVHAATLVRRAVLDPESQEASVIAGMSRFHQEKLRVAEEEGAEAAIEQSEQRANSATNQSMPEHSASQHSNEALPNSAEFHTEAAKIGRRVFEQLRLEQQIQFDKEALHRELYNVLQESNHASEKSS